MLTFGESLSPNSNFVLDGAFLTLLVAPLIFICIYIGLHSIVLLLAKLGRLHRTIKVRRVFTDQTLIAHYSPPQDIRPAEMAFIYDQVFGKEEYLATIFDLEQRNFLTITPSAKAEDFVVTLKPGFHKETLNDIDLHVLATLNITERQQRIHWRDAISHVVANDISLQNVVESELIKRGWVTKRRVQDEPGILVLLVGIAVFGILSAILVPLGRMDLLLLAICILSLLYWWPSTRNTYYRAIRMSPRFNRSFVRIWSQLEGYRMFIETVELDRIRFDNLEIQEGYRNQVLPYAVALNLKTDWQARFFVPGKD